MLYDRENVAILLYTEKISLYNRLMKTLQELKLELDEFKKCVINLSLMYTVLPDSLTMIDYEELFDEIKYLNGYIDCMIANDISLREIQDL